MRKNSEDISLFFVFVSEGDLCGEVVFSESFPRFSTDLRETLRDFGGAEETELREREREKRNLLDNFLQQGST